MINHVRLCFHRTTDGFFVCLFVFCLFCFVLLLLGGFFFLFFFCFGFKSMNNRHAQDWRWREERGGWRRGEGGGEGRVEERGGWRRGEGGGEGSC